MSARKERPALHSQVRMGMSLRDMAAALGVNKTELGRWMRLGELPEAEFERRLNECNQPAAGLRPSAKTILGHVPTRGRVQRALALVRGMSPDERAAFFDALRESKP